MTPTNSNTIGNSGEFFAASVLQREFKTIAVASSQSPFDLIAEDYSGLFFKCQVKTTENATKVRNWNYWRWRTAKSYTQYAPNEIDFFALVALNAKLIYFCLPEDIKSKIFYIRENKLNAELESSSFKKVLEKLRE